MGPSRRAVAGFSLIELMVVVVIVSILVLAVRPSFHKYLANKHSVAAAADVVRLGRRARAEAMGLARAHLLYFQPAAGVARTFGTVSLLRGNAMHCDVQNWAPFLGQCTFTVSQAPGSACADHLDLSHSHWYHTPHALVLRSVPAGQEGVADTSLTLTPPGGNAVRALCYDASGRVFWSTDNIAGAMTFNTVSDNNFPGAFTFVLGLLDDVTGQRRYPGMVLSFPLGGNPRRLR
jgi:prepilin-type N-terminal cleavage/methylation domain-containing protein